jgi:hypothetical protein
MTSVEKTAIALTLDGLEDQTPVDAEDVTIPLEELEALLAEALGLVSVSENDTHYKHIVDAVVEGDRIERSIVTLPGFNVQLQLAAVAETALTLIDEDVLSEAAAAITIDDIPAQYTQALVMALLRITHDSADGFAVRVESDATANRYYGETLAAFATTVAVAQNAGATATLLGSVNETLPFLTSPAGAFALFQMWLTGLNDDTNGVTARWTLSSPIDDSSTSIHYRAGTGFYNQLAEVDEINLIPDAGNWAAGSSWKLYGMEGL